jgi:membrane protein DedA with SNARE-associated domain
MSESSNDLADRKLVYNSLGCVVSAWKPDDMVLFFAGMLFYKGLDLPLGPFLLP